MKLIKYILLICVFSKSVITVAAMPTEMSESEDVIGLQYGKPVKLQISSNEINRISFAPKVVVAIWGDNSKYSASLSKSGSELFLTTKIDPTLDPNKELQKTQNQKQDQMQDQNLNNKIALSIEMAGGEVVDIELIAREGTGKIVLFESNKEKIKQEAEKIEIDKMLMAMKQGIRSKYYVSDIRGNKGALLGKVTARQKQIYRYENLLGLVLDIKAASGNLSKDKIFTQEQIQKIISSAYANILAIDIQAVDLDTRQSAIAYVVLARKEDV